MTKEIILYYPCVTLFGGGVCVCLCEWGGGGGGGGEGRGLQVLYPCDPVCTIT